MIHNQINALRYVFVKKSFRLHKSIYYYNRLLKDRCSSVEHWLIALVSMARRQLTVSAIFNSFFQFWKTCSIFARRMIAECRNKCLMQYWGFRPIGFFCIFLWRILYRLGCFLIIHRIYYPVWSNDFSAFT